jgi:hypothetical protein
MAASFHGENILVISILHSDVFGRCFRQYPTKFCTVTNNKFVHIWANCCSFTMQHMALIDFWWLCRLEKSENHPYSKSQTPNNTQQASINVSNRCEHVMKKTSQVNVWACRMSTEWLLDVLFFFITRVPLSCVVWWQILWSVVCVGGFFVDKYVLKISSDNVLTMVGAWFFNIISWNFNAQYNGPSSIDNSTCQMCD